MNERIIVPTKEEVKMLLTFAKNNEIVHMQTIGELLGMKWVDSLMPAIKGEPEWGYDGLRKFFADCGVDFADTIEEALNKLK